MPAVYPASCLRRSDAIWFIQPQIPRVADLAHVWPTDRSRRFQSIPVRAVIRLECGMELTERITGRVAEVTGEVELLRKQLLS